MSKEVKETKVSYVRNEAGEAIRKDTTETYDDGTTKTTEQNVIDGIIIGPRATTIIGVRTNEPDGTSRYDKR